MRGRDCATHDLVGRKRKKGSAADTLQTEFVRAVIGWAHPHNHDRMFQWFAARKQANGDARGSRANGQSCAEAVSAVADIEDLKSDERFRVVQPAQRHLRGERGAIAVPSINGPGCCVDRVVGIAELAIMKHERIV